MKAASSDEMFASNVFLSGRLSRRAKAHLFSLESFSRKGRQARRAISMGDVS